MAKVYERLLSTNILREKRRDSFDPQRVILLGEDIICMVNLLEIPRVIVFFITSERQDIHGLQREQPNKCRSFLFAVINDRRRL